MSSNDVRVTHGDVIATTAPEAQAEVERARLELMAELCALGSTMTSAMDAAPGFVPCGHAFGELVEGLCAVTGSDDARELAAAGASARARAEHVSEHRGVALGAAVFPMLDDARAALLFATLRGVAADARRAARVGRSDDGVNAFLANALSALGSGAVDDDLLVRAGRVAYAAGALVGTAR